MPENIVSTSLPIVGVKDDDDVRKCLQALFDEFARLGLGQATFEITDTHTELWVKHPETVTPDVAAIDAALRSAGDYGVKGYDQGAMRV